MGFPAHKDNSPHLNQHLYLRFRGFALAGKTVSFYLVLSLLLALTACGGGSSSTSTPPPVPSTGASPPPPTGGGGTSPVTTPQVVTVAAGVPISGIDINVSTPASSTPPNAQVLGVSAVGGGGTASDVGATISRGSTMKVLLFGPGLDGSMTVTIGGPQDIAISNIRSITATDKTPGIAFDAAVSSSAALGARSVILRTANDDITTFTGGLEVVP